MSIISASTILTPDLQKHRYLTEKEVEALTGRRVQSLRNDRCKGKGFPYAKYGRSVRYRLSDILAIMEQHRIDPEAM